MTNRISFGARGDGKVGLYISKPGFNVLTAETNNLLFSSDHKAWQFIQSGVVTLPSWANNVDNYTTISHPNLGYHPTIIVSPNVNFPEGEPNATAFGWMEHISNTQFRLRVAIHGYGYAGTCNYGIVREAQNG